MTEKFNIFKKECKNNIHVVVCMSPVGDNFRTILR